MYKKLFFRVVGGLGNQLFIYFTGKALEKKGYEVVFDLKSGFFRDKHFRKPILQELDSKIRKSNWIEIFCHFIVKHITAPKIGSFTKESSPIEFTDLNNFKHKFNFIEGYFQSYTYFDFYKKEIIQNLNFNIIDDQEYLNYLSLILSSESVCIHVRNPQKSENVPVKQSSELLDRNFYHTAIEKLKLSVGKDLIFFVFARELGWAKKNLPKGYKYVFIQPQIKNDLYDFLLMLRCKSFIIPNSTFSWWAAYISDSNKVFYRSQTDLQIGIKGNHFPKKWTQIISK